MVDTIMKVIKTKFLGYSADGKVSYFENLGVNENGKTVKYYDSIVLIGKIYWPEGATLNKPFIARPAKE